jgi:hypothetical protein
MMSVATMTVKDAHESLVFGPTPTEVWNHGKRVLVVFINSCERKMK